MSLMMKRLRVQCFQHTFDQELHRRGTPLEQPDPRAQALDYFRKRAVRQAPDEFVESLTPSAPSGSPTHDERRAIADATTSNGAYEVVQKAIEAALAVCLFS
jgi:hypothetical protein